MQSRPATRDLIEKCAITPEHFFGNGASAFLSELLGDALRRLWQDLVSDHQDVIDDICPEQTPVPREAQDEAKQRLLSAVNADDASWMSFAPRLMLLIERIKGHLPVRKHAASLKRVLAWYTIVLHHTNLKPYGDNPFTLIDQTSGRIYLLIDVVGRSYNKALLLLSNLLYSEHSFWFLKELALLSRAGVTIALTGGADALGSIGDRPLDIIRPSRVPESVIRQSYGFEPISKLLGGVRGDA